MYKFDPLSIIHVRESQGYQDGLRPIFIYMLGLREELFFLEHKATSSLNKINFMLTRGKGKKWLLGRSPTLSTRISSLLLC